MARLALEEQFKRFGDGDREAFRRRIRSSHEAQRRRWIGSKMRVREFHYWVSDGDWRLADAQPGAGRADQAEAEVAPSCGCNNGVLGVTPRSGKASDVEAALAAGGKLCSCSMGEGWRDFLEISMKPMSAPVGIENGGNHDHAIAV